jgi:hypothetical protein
MIRGSHILSAVAAICLTSVVIARADTGSIRLEAQDFSQGQVGSTQTFPEGTGKETVERICRDCHPAGDILRHKETRFRWSVIVGEMIGEGAKISDEEFEVVVSYLSVALGKKIKINEASAAAISEAFDISEEMAAAIVKQRATKGAFKDWKDVAATPGVDAKRIEEQKNNLDFGSSL